MGSLTRQIVSHISSNSWYLVRNAPLVSWIRLLRLISWKELRLLTCSSKELSTIALMHYSMHQKALPSKRTSSTCISQSISNRWTSWKNHPILLQTTISYQSGRLYTSSLHSSLQVWIQLQTKQESVCISLPNIPRFRKKSRKKSIQMYQVSLIWNTKIWTNSSTSTLSSRSHSVSILQHLK